MMCIDIIPNIGYNTVMKGEYPMDYITAQEAGERWSISDRRVRLLCAKGKIPGAVKRGKSYEIPSDAQKPADGRMRNTTLKSSERYLKWDDVDIARIDSDHSVAFSQPEYNDVVSTYACGRKAWTPEEFLDFLSERIVSRDRRDIEKILFRCGLSRYDVMQIAAVTRGIHPKDLLWIAHSRNEKLTEVMTDVFASVFKQKIDLTGESIDTPEGYNIKRYGVWKDQYGIYKQRISPLTTDIESEIAVCLLAKKLNVPCCPAYHVDKDTVFSAFLYDFSAEYIIHFRRLFDGARSDNEYRNLLSVRPQYKDDIARMILLDFITRQDDRHLSNMAIKITASGESFYPLYDNGRSLFYEDTEEMVKKAISDVASCATSFGYSGTYYDYVKELVRDDAQIGALINLNITEAEIRDILSEAGFSGYRFNGALEWITKALAILHELNEMKSS